MLSLERISERDRREKGHPGPQRSPVGTAKHVSPELRAQITLCTCASGCLLHLLHRVMSRSRVALANELPAMSPLKLGLIHGRSTKVQVIRGTQHSGEPEPASGGSNSRSCLRAAVVGGYAASSTESPPQTGSRYRGRSIPLIWKRTSYSAPYYVQLASAFRLSRFL